MINLKQIRSLIAVVQAGSVNGAADELCLAPSSVSAQLRELSSTLGVNLFESSGRGLVLSASGRQLLPKLQELLQLNNELLNFADSLKNEPAGELRLYAPSSMCIYRLPQLIEAMQMSAPAVDLHLQHDPFDYRQAIADRSIEAAVVVTNTPEPQYRHLQISEEEVIFVTHPADYSSRKLAVKDLAKRALITTEPGCSYRVAAEAHFKKHGLRLSPRQNFSNVEVIRRCLLSRMGIGLLPRCVVEEDLQQGHLKIQPVTGTPYRFQSAVIWPENAQPSPRLQALLQVIEQNNA
jgi:DNA-binding transcriptional LysR family regulator